MPNCKGLGKEDCLIDKIPSLDGYSGGIVKLYQLLNPM